MRLLGWEVRESSVQKEQPGQGHGGDRRLNEIWGPFKNFCFRCVNLSLWTGRAKLVPNYIFSSKFHGLFYKMW